MLTVHVFLLCSMCALRPSVPVYTQAPEAARLAAVGVYDELLSTFKLSAPQVLLICRRRMVGGVNDAHLMPVTPPPFCIA